MSRRATGIALIGIATFMLAMRYLAAAIFGAGAEPTYWPKEKFLIPLILSFVGLALGALYLVRAEYEEWRDRRGSKPSATDEEPDES